MSGPKAGPPNWGSLRSLPLWCGRTGQRSGGDGAESASATCLLCDLESHSPSLALTVLRAPRKRNTDLPADSWLRASFNISEFCFFSSPRAEVKGSSGTRRGGLVPQLCRGPSCGTWACLSEGSRTSVLTYGTGVRIERVSIWKVPKTVLETHKSISRNPQLFLP